MSAQTTALVTGANKGIGYEIAAGLGALGWRVGVGARDAQRREDAVDAAAGGRARRVRRAARRDRRRRAWPRPRPWSRSRPAASTCWSTTPAITGGMAQEPTTADLDVIRTVVETNVIGVIRVTNALLPLLRRSASPRIVNMSSGVGSLTRQTAPAATTPARSPSRTRRRRRSSTP